MAETEPKRRSNIAPTGTELVWEGKYDEQGVPAPVEHTALPFQTIKVINEHRAWRLFSRARAKDTGWRTRLIWGDNKYVMTSLLEECAGKIDLIYIDPAFATGQDFFYQAPVGDSAYHKGKPLARG